jgi:phosphoribosylaminoimidazole (AIR) synthetase
MSSDVARGRHAPELLPPAIAELARRCAEAAAEVARGECCSLDHLRRAAERLDAALDRVGERTADEQLVSLRDAAGDLLVAVSSAGLDSSERVRLATTLREFLEGATAGTTSS